MLTDLVTSTKFASQEIFRQKWGRGKSAGSISDWHQICHSGNLLAEMGVYLLEDLVTVTKYASQEICQQKVGGGVNLLADLVMVTKSASQQIC